MSHFNQVAVIFAVAAVAANRVNDVLAQCRCSGDCETSRYSVVQDDGSGTVVAPTFSSAFTGGRYILRAGLPVGSTIECEYRLDEFHDICPPQPGCDVVVIGPPPAPGWSAQSANGSIVLWMKGTGALSNFARTITLPMHFVAFIGPHTPGDPVQSIDTEISSLDAALPAEIGDPDFDLLAMRIGCGHQLRSPGHTTLTRLPGGNWAVDSFFDVFYEIEFIGHPGGPLDGMAGTTSGEPPVHAVSGGPLPLAPMNPVGSADVPAPDLSVTATGDETMDIINGLPPGTQFKLKPKINTISPAMIVPGSLGGPGYRTPIGLTLDGEGTGALTGHTRHIIFEGMIECHVGPIDPLADVQSLETIVQSMSAQLPPGDRDFDLLRITAGNGFGMPSPGHTTLTRMPGGNWAVDSFFDITYRIEFVGHSPGPFAGMSGSTTGTIRMTQGGELPAYELDAFGLTHMVTGAAQMDGVFADPPDPDRTLAVSNIGSSGQDGVSVFLTPILFKPNPIAVLSAGVEGWVGEIDFGPSGALPSGAMLRAKGTIKGGQGGGMGGGIINTPTLTLNALNNGQATLSLDEGCDPLCAGTLCQCCPNSPGCDSLTVAFFNNGQLVATHQFSPPWPTTLVTGPFGSDTLPTGEVSGMLITFALDHSNPAVISGYDRLHVLTRGRSSKTWQVSGGGAVQADTIRMTVEIPQNSDGTDPVLGVEQMEIKGANLPNGELSLLREGVVHSREYCVQYQESDWDFVSRLFGPGDVNGDGHPDLVVANIGSSGQDGVQFFDPGSEPFRRFWRLFNTPQDSIGVTLLVLDTLDGSLPPNGSLRASGEFEDVNGDTARAIVDIERCDSGYCEDDLITFDFSNLDASSGEVEILLDGNVVHTQTTPLVYQIWSKIKRDLQIEMERRSGGFVNGARAVGPTPIEPRAILKMTEPAEFEPSPGLLIAGDEIRFTGIASGVDLYGLLDIQLTGSNICELAILDVDVEPLPAPPCPADIAPPGGNGSVGVPDLLMLINNWGPCIPGTPCPADIAPPGGNGSVGTPDLLMIINSWGPCP